MSKLTLALAITLALDASEQDIQNAHDSIDQFFNRDDSITPQQVLDENVASYAATPAATNNADLDAAGLPWDARIHSSNKKRTAKNTWWGRKGVDAATIAKVESELRAAVAAGGAAVASAPAELAQPTLAPSGPSLGVAGAPVVQAAPSAFEKLVAAIATHSHSPANPNGILTEEFVKSVLDWKQVPDGALQNLAHMGDVVIGEVHQYIAGQLATKGVQF